MAKDEYWFNTKTQEVEAGKQSLSLDRIGPFSTYEAAQNALAIIEQRAKAIREEEDEEDFSK
ncbi:MAG: hypothetical protein RLZ99_783 [Actinomycetota bacterium]|jgi:hypothetical protein